MQQTNSKRFPNDFNTTSMFNEPSGIINPIYYSIENESGHLNFGKSNAKWNLFNSLHSFKENKLQSFPYGINCNVYKDEEEWKEAQRLLKNN